MKIKHYNQDGVRTACGRILGSNNATNDEDFVTCKKCLKRIEESEIDSAISEFIHVFKKLSFERKEEIISRLKWECEI